MLLLRLYGSNNEGKCQSSAREHAASGDIGRHVVRLMIGSNLLSVGVKWYLISRMA